MYWCICSQFCVEIKDIQICYHNSKFKYVDLLSNDKSTLCNNPELSMNENTVMMALGYFLMSTWLTTTLKLQTCYQDYIMYDPSATHLKASLSMLSVLLTTLYCNLTLRYNICKAHNMYKNNTTKSNYLAFCSE